MIHGRWTSEPLLCGALPLTFTPRNRDTPGREMSETSRVLSEFVFEETRARRQPICVSTLHMGAIDLTGAAN
ncbi:hypothetical protein Trco_005613 [Trichoderma cornu-damae]|uniref:Uncharacterized protein n=1 Tax=Trichoderma cornu-damae TaxID=654480 RepID=A0A9P8QJB6_9HYPO|nr:hypothetical protein Trco_005613 [Trichoderma cornu-damae]